MSGYFSQLSTMALSSHNRIRPRIPFSGEMDAGVADDNVAETVTAEARGRRSFSESANDAQGATEKSATEPSLPASTEPDRAPIAAHRAEDPTVGPPAARGSETRRRFSQHDSNEEPASQLDPKYVDAGVSGGQRSSLGEKKTVIEPADESGPGATYDSEEGTTNAGEPSSFRTTQRASSVGAPPEETREMRKENRAIASDGVSEQDRLSANIKVSPRELVDRAHDSLVSPPIVKVTIGRLEVGTAPQAKPSPVVAIPRGNRTKRVELEEFLDNRRKERR